MLINYKIKNNYKYQDDWEIHNRLNEPSNKCPCKPDYIDKIVLDSGNTDPDCFNCHYSCTTCSDS